MSYYTAVVVSTALAARPPTGLELRGAGAPCLRSTLYAEPVLRRAYPSKHSSLPGFIAACRQAQSQSRV